MSMKLVTKRDLKDFFPKEFTNKTLLSQFIDYIMNHFFQNSSEEYINGYIGKKTVACESGDFYIEEKTAQRQAYQLTPSLITKSENGETEVIDYCNFINTLKTQGCDIEDQNRLLSCDLWSWCPPINVDMFINYNYYYWIEEGCEAFDIYGKTNAVLDIIGQKEYTYTSSEENDIKFMSGLRIRFNNDVNEEYNNKIFIVEGVGSSITLINDDEILYSEDNKPDYFVMERGCLDGNPWSKRNRWFHRSVVTIKQDEKINKYVQAKKPIICFNKDIELYNYGTYDRGYVDLMADCSKNDINGSSNVALQGVELKDGMTILITGDSQDINNNRIYQVSGITTIGTVVLQPIVNGLSLDGSAVKGENIYIRKGYNANRNLHFDGVNWVEGQLKTKVNQSPLFNLYDDNKVQLDDLQFYPKSSFEGSKIFDYKTSEEDIIVDEDLDKKVLTSSYGNYIFDNLLETTKYTYDNNETVEEIIGMKFYKINQQDVYLNNWYLSKKTDSQYITREIIIPSENIYENLVDEQGFYTTYMVFKLAFQPIEDDYKKSSYVYLNGNILNENMNYFIKDKKLYLNMEMNDLHINDSIYIKMLIEHISEVPEGYFYELPLELTANPLNQNITDIKYSECFDQMKSIIENQIGFEGSGSGLNNYLNTKQDLSLGSEILQHSYPMIKTMLLNSKEYTNVRNVFEYVKLEYTKFKTRFRNTIENMSNQGSYLEEDNDDIDRIIYEALNRINLGKDGIEAFYNNGVANYYGDCYIPATPAYLGISKCYEPKIIEFNEKFVLLCHDGSFTMLFNDFRDSALLRLEEKIYESIPSNFKEGLPLYNIYKNIPGKFRKNDYSLEQFNEYKSSLLEKWALNEKITLDMNNSNFYYSDPFTWNYSTCKDADGEQLYGSYKAIYMYYYDTYTPHTTPWEMLGFAEQPYWWEEHYGKAPYTSNNISMWKDIEEGHIVEGVNEGYYQEFAREGLYEKYLPVDSEGQLLNPIEIGIVEEKPTMLQASASWLAGDLGKYEEIWMHTSSYWYDLQEIMYLMRPTEWIEENWDNLNKEILFKNTQYEQKLNADIKDRPSPNEEYFHNENIDGSYIQKIGVQQWFSDFLVHQNIDITSYIGNEYRNSEIKLTYRCGRYFKKDSLKILSDNYGVLPKKNYEIILHKSLTDKVYTYSAMMIIKTENGYMINGYDTSEPYFYCLKPNTFGTKTQRTIGGKSVYYYNVWEDEIIKVRYKSVYTSVQEIYNIICGYGKYLESQGWIFDKVLEENTTPIDFNNKADDFVLWTSVNPEDDIMILLNPGYSGMTLEHEGFLDIAGQYINGQWSILNAFEKPIYNNGLLVYRHNGYSEINTRSEVITMIKAKTIENEHMIVFDNKTVYGDTIYDPLLCVKTQRLKVIGVGVKDWDGSFYAPGYLIENDGAIANYDKWAEDFRYFFDTDDIRSQGLFGTYAKKTIGFKDIAYMERMLVDDRNIFDFYKGMIREKGTRRTFNKLNRSTYIMSDVDSKIELYENWLFKLGEFGNTSAMNVMELAVKAEKITEDPQIFSFTPSDRKGEDENKVNYTIYYNDEEWIKKLSNKSMNKFQTTDLLQIMPTGGFAKIDEVDYILADLNSLEENEENIEFGENVWVVNTGNKTWNILKKMKEFDDEGEVVTRWMSLRVDNYNQLLNFNKQKLNIGDLVYVSKIVIADKNDYKDPTHILDKKSIIKNKPIWGIFKYNGTDFELYRVQETTVDTSKFDKCYIINDNTNESLSEIMVYDPMQLRFPNNILEEVNYITAFDPVSDYNNYYQWGDEKVGYLWWDLSKVKYIDYHQGDLYYRRKYWGKQLPGSEIAIMEWTKSSEQPKEGNYVTKRSYNYKTASFETYYYYWVKNSPEIPNVDFRSKSALQISLTINSPQEQGIIWMAPININEEGLNPISTMVLGNFDKVTTGTDFVIQINFKNNEYAEKHAEWIMVREGDDDLIPTNLWNKMCDSLIGCDSNNNVVPEASLDDRNKIGLGMRPRQTMFKDMIVARKNFVSVINDIFESRDVTKFTDVGTELFEEIFNEYSSEPEFYYEYPTYYDMIQNKDADFIGKNLLVRNDELHNGIWTLWKMESIGKYTLIDYQKYDVKRYWEYKDLYADDEALNAQPIATFNSELEARNYIYENIVMIGDVVKINTFEGWYLKRMEGYDEYGNPQLPTIALQNGTINLTSKLYDYLEDGSEYDTEEFIDGMTKYEYLKQEVTTVLRKIISYFEKLEQ